MAKTANLAKAKETKNDEFYTQYADIQKEVNAYLEFDPDTFRGKSVLLPCDDPEWSNFTNFFGTSAVTGFEYTYDLFGRPVRRKDDAFACDSHQGAGGVGGLVAVSVAGM